MEPATPGIWRQIPGDDGNSDTEEDEEEVAIKATAQERYAQIVELLGDKWVETPFLEFQPATKPKDMKVGTTPPTRVWGPNGPLPGFRIEHTDALIVRETFLSNGLVPAQDKDWLVQWSGPGMREYAYQGLHEYQRVNHFPGSSELTRKDRMWKHLLEKAKTFGRGTFDFCPETFVLPEQLEQFLECYEHSEHLWIVKPHASSRGRGIFLLRDSAELPLDELSVVSRYIENPLLIQGLKWDLRVYVVVTSFEPLRAYIYREGLTRFASSPYSTDEEDLQDAYRHLTNYSINKSADNFVENKEVKADNVGHKWSLSALLKHLKCVGVDVELMWARIHDLIFKTLLAVEPTISSRTREIATHSTNCFEVYGFDVLVDEDLKPWLIEVNLSPSMQAESPLDWQIKTALLADTFNLVGIAHPDERTISNSKLRSRFAQAREASTPMGVRFPASTSALRPVSATSKMSSAKALTRENPAEAAEPKGLVLDSLTEGQLKMMASALSEIGRRHNFIRLYPTKATVKRYAPMMDPRKAPSPRPRDVRFPSSPAPTTAGSKPSASQLLASLLFGPTPVRSAPAPPLVRSRSSMTSAQRDRASLRSTFHGSTTFGRGEVHGGVKVEGAHGDNAVRALCTKSGQRLLFMEYLLRVSSSCEGLSHNDKAKICQSPSYARLCEFHRQLKQRQRARKEEGEEDPDPSTDLEPDLELNEGGLIDDLMQLCSSTLESLAKDVWEAEATLQDSAAPPRGHGQRDGGNLTMEDVLPPAFAASALGQKVVNGLSMLSAADLERVLAGQQCAPEFRLHLGLAAERQEEGLRPQTGSGVFPFDAQCREGPHHRPPSGVARRPCSGNQLRRSRQERRPSQPQFQAGPLHDLLRVPQETFDPADMRNDNDGPGQASPSLPPSRSAPPSHQQQPDSPTRRLAGGYAGTGVESRRLSVPGGREGSTIRALSRPISAYNTSVKSSSLARPPSSKARQIYGDSPMNPAERASGVLARVVIGQATRSDPALKIPVTRSVSTLPEMQEALLPVRHRPSHSIKMQTTSAPLTLSAPTRATRPAVVEDVMNLSTLQQGTMVHAAHWNMDIEL